MYLFIYDINMIQILSEKKIKQKIGNIYFIIC